MNPYDPPDQRSAEKRADSTQKQRGTLLRSLITLGFLQLSMGIVIMLYFLSDVRSNRMLVIAGAIYVVASVYVLTRVKKGLAARHHHRVGDFITSCLAACCLRGKVFVAG